jgi:nicotinamide-nucleotide amidase
VNLDELLNELQKKLQQQQAKLALAESCTGGMIASLITSQSGSSLWFDRAYITYNNQAKIELLSVKTTSLDKYGAVSQTVAQEMVQGCLLNSNCDYALSVTGIAGPGGGSLNKPVGMVWFAWAKYVKNEKNKTDVITVEHHQLQIKSKLQKFSGDRKEIREKSVKYALTQLLGFINQ